MALTVEDKLRNPHAYLHRGDLFALGLGRRAVDAIFKAIGEQTHEGCRRKVVRVDRWLAHRETFTYRRNRPRPRRQ